MIKGLSVIVTGTAVAQVLRVLVSPLLTRLYDPADFGLFAIFVSVLSILSIASCFRYDLAIPTLSLRHSVRVLGFLCVVINTIFCLVLVISLFSILNWQPDFLGMDELAGSAYLIPLALFFTATVEIYIKLVIYEKKYSIIARARILQVAVMCAVQVSFFTYGISALILGQIVGYAVTALYLISVSTIDLRGVSLEELPDAAKANKNYPKFSLWSGLVSAISTNSVPLVLAAFYSSTVVGLYALTVRILSLPAGMVGEAFRSVFLGEAPQHYRDGELDSFIRKINLLLVRFSFLPFAFIVLYAEKLFEFVFGAEWSGAGEYAVFLAPLIYIQFKWAPLSMIGNILDKQKEVLILQGLSTSIRYAVLFVALYFDALPVVAIMVYSFVSVFVYYIMIAWFFRYVSIGILEIISADMRYFLLGILILYPIGLII